MKTVFNLLNVPAPVDPDPDLSFLEGIAVNGRTEQGEPLKMTRWFTDYCEMVGDMGLELVVTIGASQLGKSIAPILWACHLARSGYRPLIVLPTRTYLRRNIKIQIAPLAAHWGIEPVGTEVWPCGKGAILFGFTSTSGDAPSKEGLASVGGTLSSISADAAIVDETSQMTAEEFAGIYRRLDASRLPSRPKRIISTPGGGLGVERLARDLEQIYPHATCPHCGRSFRLDPFTCLFAEMDRSGWVSTWNLGPDGEPCIHCPSCRTPIPHYQAYFPRPTAKRVAVHLTPLLRENAPAYLFAAQKDAQANSLSKVADFLQQCLGVPSNLAEETRITVSSLKDGGSGLDPFEALEPMGVFIGVDQGIGVHYLCKAALFRRASGRLAIKVITLAEADETQIVEACEGVTFGLIDAKPDRTLAHQLTQQTATLYLAQQKYSGGAFKRDTISIGTASALGYSLPLNAAHTIWEASRSGALQILCPITDQIVRHLTSPHYDSVRDTIARPKNHNDDLFFSLYFAVSAAFCYAL